MHSKICLLFIALLLPLYAFNQIPTFEKHYDTLGCYYSNCVRQNIDGGYILCGSSYNANSAQDAAIIRTDSLGNIIWVKEYGTSTTDGAIGCLIAFDSNLIIVGIKEGFSAWAKRWPH